MEITATPRPDILLSVIEDSPNLRQQFIFDQVFPPFRANVSTGPVPKVLRRTRIERIRRARYGAFPRSAGTVESAGTFDCTEEGFEEVYDRKDIEIFGSEDRCQRVTGQKALQANLLSREYTLAQTLMTTSTFGSGYNTAGAAAWDNASGKPLDDIAAAKDNVEKRIGMEPNTIIMGAGTKLALDKNATMQSAVRAILGQTDREGVRFNLSQELLATVFGVERVLIGKATYDSADEGQTASLTRIWPDAYCLVCYTGNPSEDDLSPQLGRTFVWDEGLMGLDPDIDEIPTSFAGVTMEQYYEPKNIGVMRARDYLDFLLLNKEAGHLLTGL